MNLICDLSFVAALITVCTDLTIGQQIFDEYNIELFQNKTCETLGYNKYVRPRIERPIVVKTSVFLYSFASLDDSRTEYSIQVLLRLEWRDERLAINTKDNRELRLEGGQWHANRIWTPSLHIPNNKEPQALQNSEQNPVLLHIFSTGKVLLSKRILLNGMSKMDFRLYPMDKQTCDIEIESNDLSDDLMKLEWSEQEPYASEDDFAWNGFKLLNYSLTSKRSSYTHTGTFSRLTVTFIMKREFSHFILDVYIPSILFVITSWASFWIEIPAAPARVTLCITTMLTLVTSSKATRDQLPKVAYINALDIWILICIFFVFASLVEYAAVNFIYNKEKRSKKRRRLASFNNNQNGQGMCRTFSNTSIKSSTSDSVFDDSYSNFPSNQLLAVPSSPTLKNPDRTQPYLKNMTGGGIELVVPAISKDVESGHGSHKSVSVRSVRVKPVRFEVDEIDIANSIDRKCRYLFPISFVAINLVYWITLAMMSFYD